jgi:Fe-S-cluster containining protein
MSEERIIIADDSDEEAGVTEEQRAYIREMVERLMEKRIFVVYGDEDGTEEVSEFDHEGRKDTCKAVCCSFVFALTKKDVEKGIAQWNPKRPYFIARDADGFCPHLNRANLMCMIWDDRPERCRNYDCRKDKNVWDDWEKETLNRDAFRHLPEKS